MSLNERDFSSAAVCDGPGSPNQQQEGQGGYDQPNDGYPRGSGHWQSPPQTAYPPRQGGFPEQEGGYDQPDDGYLSGPGQRPPQACYPPWHDGYPHQEGGYDQPGDSFRPGQRQWRPPPQTGYPGEHVQKNTTVIVQGGTYGPRPNNFLAFSIVTLICFNLLFGIIALIFSILSHRNAERGDMEQAKGHSRCALGWNISALVLFVLLIIVVPVWVVISYS